METENLNNRIMIKMMEYTDMNKLSITNSS